MTLMSGALPNELPRCNDKYIYDALDLLELEAPDITVLSCIYFDRSTNYIVPSDQLWADITQNFISVCAFENDQSGSIFVAEYILDEDFDPDPEQQSRRYYARFSEAELLKTCFHQTHFLRSTRIPKFLQSAQRTDRTPSQSLQFY